MQVIASIEVHSKASVQVIASIEVQARAEIHVVWVQAGAGVHARI